MQLDMMAPSQPLAVPYQFSDPLQPRDGQHNVQDEIDCAAYETQHAQSEVEHCELPKENIEGHTRCYAFVAVPPSYVQTRGADAADTSDYPMWILAMNAA